MGKCCGFIGLATTEETTPGVWEETIRERRYVGDVLRVSRRLQSTDQTNDDIEVSNEISIVSDPYLCSSINDMRYITWMGNKWKIVKVVVQYPRLILSIGGIYNE